MKFQISFPGIGVICACPDLGKAGFTVINFMSLGFKGASINDMTALGMEVKDLETNAIIPLRDVILAGTSFSVNLISKGTS